MTSPLLITNTKLQISLVGGLAGATTGLSRYARNLQQALLSQAVTVSLVGTKAPPLPSPSTALASKLGFDLKTFFKTYPVSLEKAPAQSLIHLTSQNQASAVAFSAPSRFIVTVHDLITVKFRYNPELTGYLKPYDKLFDNLMVRGLKKASGLIAISQNSKEDIIQYLDYPSKRIKVIYQGVDHATFKPAPLPEGFLARYNLQVDGEYLLYVGSEDPRKNLRRLLDAFRQLAKDRPTLRLLKVGAARFQSERQELMKYIVQAGIQDKVLFFDQVSDADLAAFYNLAQVFVFPSLYEGFGLPALEAMACGTPVVASNTASLPEIVGAAALTVNPYQVEALTSAIGQALDDNSLRTRLRQQGLERAAQFTWQRTALETLAFYEQHL